jgi:hypothetical protein
MFQGHVGWDGRARHADAIRLGPAPFRRGGGSRQRRAALLRGDPRSPTGGTPGSSWMKHTSAGEAFTVVLTGLILGALLEQAGDALDEAEQDFNPTASAPGYRSSRPGPPSNGIGLRPQLNCISNRVSPNRSLCFRETELCAQGQRRGNIPQKFRETPAETKLTSTSRPIGR